MNALARTIAAGDAIEHIGEAYGGSFSIFNKPEGLLTDVGRVILDSLLQFGPGWSSEKSHDSWQSLLESGIFDNGGVIVAHSQGAQIATHALQSFYERDTKKNKTQATLVTLGGAHSIRPLEAINHMVDMRNNPDWITGAIRVLSDYAFFPLGNLVNSVLGRDYSKKYQSIEDVNYLSVDGRGEYRGFQGPPGNNLGSHGSGAVPLIGPEFGVEIDVDLRKENYNAPLIMGMGAHSVRGGIHRRIALYQPRILAGSLFLAVPGNNWRTRLRKSVFLFPLIMGAQLIFATHCCSVPLSQFFGNGWKEFKHEWRTGDHGTTFLEPDVQITRERIAQLRPGVSTERDVRQVFQNRAVVQKTYPIPYFRKYNGRIYRVDRHVAFIQIVPARKPKSGNILRGWDERIGMRAFFYRGILQYYRVSHEVRLPGDAIAIGPLDTTEDHEKERRHVRCDQRLYELQIGLEPLPSQFAIKDCTWYEDFLAGKLTTEPIRLDVSPPNPAQGVRTYKMIYPENWEEDE